MVLLQSPDQEREEVTCPERRRLLQHAAPRLSLRETRIIAAWVIDLRHQTLTKVVSTAILLPLLHHNSVGLTRATTGHLLRMDRFGGRLEALPRLRTENINGHRVVMAAAIWQSNSLRLATTRMDRSAGVALAAPNRGRWVFTMAIPGNEARALPILHGSIHEMADRFFIMVS